MTIKVPQKHKSGLIILTRPRISRLQPELWKRSSPGHCLLSLSLSLFQRVRKIPHCAICAAEADLPFPSLLPFPFYVPCSLFYIPPSSAWSEQVPGPGSLCFDTVCHDIAARKIKKKEEGACVRRVLVRETNSSVVGGGKSVPWLLDIFAILVDNTLKK